jgi:hypothetical protein
VVEVGLDGENRYWSTEVAYAPGARQKPAPPPSTAAELSERDAGLAGAAPSAGARDPLAASQPGNSPEATLVPPTTAPAAGSAGAPAPPPPNFESAAKSEGSRPLPWLAIVALAVAALGLGAWLFRSRAEAACPATDGAADPHEPLEHKEFSRR